MMTDIFILGHVHMSLVYPYLCYPVYQVICSMQHDPQKIELQNPAVELWIRYYYTCAFPGQPEVATYLPLIYYLIHTPLLRSAEECTTSYTCSVPAVPCSVHCRYTAAYAVYLQYCTLHGTAGTLHFGLGNRA